MASSIDDLKAEINNRGGIGRTNRFNVIFTPPTQALINIDFGAILGSLIRGDFNKNQLITDPRSLTLLCESASLPSRSMTTKDFDLISSGKNAVDTANNNNQLQQNATNSRGTHILPNSTTDPYSYYGQVPYKKPTSFIARTADFSSFGK